MPLIRGSERVENRFRKLSEGEAIPAEGAILLSLETWKAQRDSLKARGGVGVWLAPHESSAEIADDLDGLELVALEFPAFKDGRAFTSARLLRERHGYKGELRAIGEVLAEQVPFMVRSGFDSFDMPSEADADECATVLSELSVVYQPTGDGRPTALRLRHS